MAIFPARVLLATDGSPDATLAAESAIELSERTGSELHIVHVGEYVPTYFAYTEEEPAELRRNAQLLLDEQAERIEAAGGTIAGAHLRLGHPAEQIIALGEESGASFFPRAAAPPPRPCAGPMQGRGDGQGHSGDGVDPAGRRAW